MKITVQVWSDLVCPWCGLGLKRLHDAAAAFGDQVSISHHSFRLDPMGLEDQTRPVAQMLATDKGWSAQRIAAETGRIETLAHDEGLADYVVGENVTGNTAYAHELLAFATEQGKGQQLWPALMYAHFARQVDIFDRQELVAFAARWELDAREVFQDRRFRRQVMADQSAAERIGARGVPFVVINGTTAIAGAATSAALGDHIAQALGANGA